MTNRAEDKILCTYKYRDEAEKLLYETVRFYPKDFRQRRPDGAGGWIWNLDGIRRVLYRLPELSQAHPNDIVYIPEGEKDVEALRALGLVATTNAMGAGKWRSEYAESLRGRSCVLLPDSDEPGRRHMAEVARSLTGIAKSVRIVELPDLPRKGDVSDWLAAGGTKEKLEQFVAEAPEYEAAPAPVATASEDSFHEEPIGDEVWMERKLFQTGADTGADDDEWQFDWIAYPWLAAGATTEIIGKVKAAGKTTFATFLCAAVVNGNDFLGQPTTRTPVVYLTEQPQSSFNQAIERAGLKGLADFHYLRWGKVAKKKWPEVMQIVARYCCEVGARLLIVDTFLQWAAIKDENSSAEAMEALRPIQVAASENNMAVLLIRHERKSGGSVSDAGRGSSATSGAVDVIMTVHQPEGAGNKCVRIVKSLSRFEATPDELQIELTADGYVARGEIRPQAVKQEKLISLLPNSEEAAFTCDQLTEASGEPRTSVDRYLKALLKRNAVVVVGSGKKGDPHRYYCAEIHSTQTTTAEKPSWKEKIRSAATPISAARAMLAGIFFRPRVDVTSGLAPLPDGTDFDPEFFPEPERPTDACAECSGTEYRQLANQEWVCSACHPA